MATLVNRDWFIANNEGKPLKVRCLSHNVVLATCRVVTDDGVFSVVPARALQHAPESIVVGNYVEDPALTAGGQ